MTRRARMDYDEVARERGETIADNWLRHLNRKDNILAIRKFVQKHRMGAGGDVSRPKVGRYDVHIRVKFSDGGSAVMRMPIPGRVMFPEEKIRQEVATIRYIQDHTSIPVPFIFHWGTEAECPNQLGPFMITEYIGHHCNMATMLKRSGSSKDARLMLDPDIDLQLLQKMYGQLADILLQLSGLTNSQICCLSQVNEDDSQSSRPLTQDMESLVACGTLPQSALPSAPFDSSSAYYQALADLHIKHLQHQRNGAIWGVAEGHMKFIARHTFRALVRDGRLLNPQDDSGRYSLWCDDLNPSSVLLDQDLNVVGIVDWGFSYFAPSEFSEVPPWWLLIDSFDKWENGLEDWTMQYEIRLQTFLQVLRDREELAITSGRLNADARLASRMQARWEKGDFWVVHAARQSFAFDCIYWRKIHRRFYGDGGTESDVERKWMMAIGLLSREEELVMKECVDKQMQFKKEKALCWDPDPRTIRWGEKLGEEGSEGARVRAEMQLRLDALTHDLDLSRRETSQAKEEVEELKRQLQNALAAAEGAKRETKALRQLLQNQI